MFTFNHEIAAVPAGEGVTRKVLSHSGSLMVCEIILEEASVIAPHAHPHEQITYIISGKCRYTVGEETREVGAGDSVLIPGNVTHSIVILETMKVIDVFTPRPGGFSVTARSASLIYTSKNLLGRERLRLRYALSVRKPLCGNGR